MSDHTDRRTLYEAYYVNRRTTKDIAAQYHVHHTTITYWLRKHRIKRPPPLPKGKPRCCCYCGTSFLALPGSRLKYCSQDCQFNDKDRLTPTERHRLRCEYLLRSNPTYNKMLNRLIREQGPDDGHREALDIVCKAEPILDTTREKSLP